jgi:hypothetical protein
MSRWLKILLLVPLLAVAGLAAVAVALHFWISSDDFRGRVEREASATLGVPVRLGGVAVDLVPLPAVALDRVSIRSSPPLTLERVEARPVWLSLLQGRLEVATLVVRKAVVPEAAVAVVSAAMLRKRERTARMGQAPAGDLASKQGWWPRRARLEQLSWVDSRGITTTVDAEVALADDGLPASASVKVLRGRLAGARATLKRQGGPWLLSADIGGGRVIGTLTLRPVDKSGSALLQGSLATTNVEIAALTAPSKTLTGRLYAKTTLRAQLRDLGGLAEALQTQTQFTLRNAVIHGVDLQQAVKTVGLSRGGDTYLDAFAGRLATQGKTVHLTNLVASSGVLSATGDITMAPSKALSGGINVNLAGGAGGSAVAVPLVVAGTLDEPSVTLTRGALIGAAIGTAILPGVGTGAGARLGERLGGALSGLFGK